MQRMLPLMKASHNCFSQSQSIVRTTLLPRTNQAIQSIERRGSRGDKIAPDLREAMESAGSNGRVTAILQVDDVHSGDVRSLLARHDALVSDSLAQLGVIKAQVPVTAIEELARSGLTNYLSSDANVQAYGGHIASTTGANLVRSQTNSSGVAYNLNGTGIGIAILDSGITQDHKDFLNQRLDHTRVTFAKDFTSERFLSSDRYGHGTHVAGLAAGMGFISNGSYIGIAPNASIINLKVLDRNGKGKISDVLSALNWLLRNYQTYNIRVVNMSLGTPAISSYKNDALCRAVRKLVDAGIVVVA